MNDKECIEKIAHFLRRLIEPRYDEYETNDYVNRSTDCMLALEAFQEWEASQPSNVADQNQRPDDSNAPAGG